MSASAPSSNPLSDPLARLNRWLQTESDTAVPADVLAALAAQLGPRGQGNLGIAQINTTPGDLQGNARRIMTHIRIGEAIGLDLVVFPELALMGYPVRDVIVRHPFLVAENMKWLRAIAARTGETHALVGFVEPRMLAEGKKRIGKEYFNALAVLGEGEIKALVRKCLLPTYHEFEDYRQFEPSPASGAHHPETLGMAEWGFSGTAVPDGNPYMIHGINYGLSICEDMWDDPDFFESPVYEKDPMAELAAARPRVLVNISASPSRSRKEQMKHNLCAHLAKKHGIPLVYANQVGSVDEVNFDGTSRVYDRQGQLVARARAFEEQLLIANPLTGLGEIHPLPLGLAETLTAQKVFNAYDTSDLGRTYECLMQGIRDYFGKTGFEKAVIGLSGGLDSSVTAVLLADALGPQNVLGVSMPTELTPPDNRTDARQLADNLGIHFVEIPIGSVVTAFGENIAPVRGTVEAFWGKTDPRSNALDNVQAISRATVLRQMGNEFRALPVATSDKSELYLGYATVNGDMSGALAPLGDVPKTKVRALARWLNEHRPAHVKTPRGALPESVITKPSGADLKKDPVTGKLVTAEEDLMPYEFADEIIWRIEALGQSRSDMLTARFQYEETHVLSAGQKAEWLARFFERMARAVFKWFIVPPILIVEGNGSIAKTDYHHPIVANRIHWQGHRPEEICHILDEVNLKTMAGAGEGTAPVR